MRVAVVVVAVLLAACKSPPPAAPEAPPPDPAADAAIVKLGGFRDQACACKPDDVQCPLVVAKARLDFFAAEHGRYAFTESQRVAAAEANEGYQTCAARQPEVVLDSAQALVELRGLRDEMCACKDQACAEAVTEKMMEMGKRYEDTKASDAQMAEAQKIVEPLTACMAKLLGAPQ